MNEYGRDVRYILHRPRYDDLSSISSDLVLLVHLDA